MTIMAPKNKWELSDMMKFAMEYNHPVAVRYPRGTAYDGLKEFRSPIELGKSEIIYKGNEIALFALGSMVITAEKVADILKENGIDATLVNARFAKPFDEQCILDLSDNHRMLVTLEENVLSGGLGEHISTFVQQEGIDMDVINIAIPNAYVEHGNVEQLKKILGIDAESVAARILEKYKNIRHNEVL